MARFTGKGQYVTGSKDGEKKHLQKKIGEMQDGTINKIAMQSKISGKSYGELAAMEYMNGGKSMLMSDYQKKAARTICFDLKKEEVKAHALHGMVGEIGEIHSLYQKVYQGHDLEEEHLKKEVGDLLWFVAEYCTAMGWNMGDVAKMNIEKLKRRYPTGFDTGRSLNRRAGDV